MLKPLCSPLGSSEQRSFRQAQSSSTLWPQLLLQHQLLIKILQVLLLKCPSLLTCRKEKNNYTSQIEPFPLKKKNPIPQGRKYELALTLLSVQFFGKRSGGMEGCSRHLPDGHGERRLQCPASWWRGHRAQLELPHLPSTANTAG